MKVGTTLYVRDRAEWRRWLARHAKREKEIWLVYPKKASGKTRISYNDAVDEALCFGWIDSINKALGKDRYAQRFTPRRPNSKLSAMNRERALRLVAAGRMTKAGQRALGDQLKARPLRMRADVRAALRAAPGAWTRFQRFPASYRRIRIGWVEAARDRPDEFRKRLRYFVAMTAKNKRYGMVR